MASIRPQVPIMNILLYKDMTNVTTTERFGYPALGYVGPMLGFYTVGSLGGRDHTPKIPGIGPLTPTYQTFTKWRCKEPLGVTFWATHQAETGDR